MEDLIKQYGIAHRAWYTNQHNVEKLKRVERLERKVKKLLHEPGNSEKYYDAFMKEHWNTVFVQPEV